MKKFSIFLLLPFLVGCIKESYEHCPNNATITYFYTLHNDGGNRFDNEVDSLKLYLFDSVGRFYKTMEFYDGETDLSNEHKLPLDLPVGSWQVVAVGGNLSEFDVPNLNTTRGLEEGVSSLEEFQFGLKDVQEHNTVIDKDLKKLFYGQITPVEIGEGGQSVEYKSSMTNNVKNLVINITGMQNLTKAIDPNSQIEVKATIQNSALDANNNVHPNAKTTIHTGQMTNQGDTLTTTINTLRLHTDNTSAKLILKSPYLQSDSVEVPIVSSIMQNPSYQTQEQLDREDTYKFDFNVQKDLSDKTSITIEVNGWKIINIEGAL